MDKRLVILLIVSALLIYGCTSPQAKQCPASCDDSNSCTNDYCDASTNFECVHANLSGDQVGCSGSAGLCKTKTCSVGSCGTSSIKNCYANAEYRFSVMYPDGWKAVEDAMGATVIFAAPMEANTTSSCNVFEGEVPIDHLTDEDLGELENSTKEVLGRTFTNYTFISGGKRIVNGVLSYEIISTFTQGVYNIKAQQVVVIKDRTIHTITCAATTDLFGKYQPKFEKIIASFKIE